jgi:hypothetical protein
MDRASFGLNHLSSVELSRFRDYLVTKKSPATVNVALAVIQTALADAFNDGLVDANEAARVKKLDERAKGDRQRRAFKRCPKLILQLDSHADHFSPLLAKKVEFSFHFRARSINSEAIRVRTIQLLQELAIDRIVLGPTRIKRLPIAG